MDNKYLEISALTKYIKYKFDTDDHLKKVYLQIICSFYAF